MVRIKHRYLLVNILYPDSDLPKPAQADSKLPAVVDFRQPAPVGLTAGLLVKHIREHVELLYGDYGAGIIGGGLTIKYFSPATSTFIVRCPIAHYRLIWSALTFMTNLPKLDFRKGRQQGHQQPTKARACVMRVVRVSGTIRKSEEEAIRRARADIFKAQRQAGESTSGQGPGNELDAIIGSADDGLGARGIEDVDMTDDDKDDEM